MREHDWPQVRQACHELVRYARREVAALTGVDPVVPDEETWFSQMAVLPIPPCDMAALRNGLHDEYDIEIPPTRWDGHSFVRLSVQGYNTRADIDRLIEALGALLPKVMQES
jgi:isopenicillin-N epimerase